MPSQFSGAGLTGYACIYLPFTYLALCETQGGVRCKHGSLRCVHNGVFTNLFRLRREIMYPYCTVVFCGFNFTCSIWFSFCVVQKLLLFSDLFFRTEHLMLFRFVLWFFRTFLVVLFCLFASRYFLFLFFSDCFFFVCVARYLGNTVKLVGIGPPDIVDGNVTLTLGMMWSLIVFFMAKDLGDAGDGLSVLKKRWPSPIRALVRSDMNTTPVLFSRHRWLYWFSFWGGGVEGDFFRSVYDEYSYLL